MFDWRTIIVLTHRWLGIAGCVLFAVWFVSGIVMMYVRMPEVTPEERLARAPGIDLSAATVSPSAVLRARRLRVSQVQVVMLQQRPAYRLSGRAPLIVFADTGETFAGLDRVGAADVARQWAPAGRQIRYDAYLTEPDQWTLQTTLPVHRFAVDDMTGTYVYVSQATGEVVQRTTRRERFWASLGPVLHWIYFTRLRKHGRLWNNVVIWSSLVGCVLCATGLLWGCLQFSLGRRFRIRGAPAASPYTELMKWHHYAGLFFGLVTLTWVYSGLLSLEPFNWFASDDFTPEQREAAAGGPLRVDQLTLDSMRTALSIFPFEPKQLDVVQVRGEPFWVAQRAPSQQSVIAWMDAALLPRAPRPPLKRYYASAIHPERGLRLRFAPEAMEDIAHAVMAGAPVQDKMWLHEYDGYYYDPRGSRPLPVLRIQYGDPQRTWLYLDPQRGGIVLRVDRVTRLRRWLYHGLHSLDFPFLYFRRPLWDLVVIVLSTGGIVLSVTTMLPAWRRLRAHVAAALRRASRSPRSPP